MDAGEAVGLKNIGKRRLLHNRQAQRGLDRVRDVGDPILSCKNRPTASSLAAFRAVQAVPPSCAACFASTKHGNAVSSIASNVSGPQVKRSSAGAGLCARFGYVMARPIGMRISGTPNCASTAPSTNSTRECTTDCR